jgi:hypothetical protein
MTRATRATLSTSCCGGRLARLAALVLPLTMVLGCGGTFSSGSNPDGGSSGRDGTAPRRDGTPPELGWPDPPRQDAGCGGQSIPIVLTQKGDIPDLHLVVDRSGSMILPVDIFQLQLGSKWDVMRRTLGSLLNTYSTNIRFGLSLYPNGSDCGPGQIDVGLTLGASAKTKAVLDQSFPTGSTPTHTTLDVVRAYLNTVPLGKGPRYALLATDGMPNCGAQKDATTSAETLAAVQALVAAGVKVFVVGFGEIITGNPALLDQLAVAGGVPNPAGPFKFYAAANEAQLKQAFFNIAGGLVPPPCTYKLQSAPPDPDLVKVTFDGKPVPRTLSNKDGWNYTANGSEITFFGAACDLLRTGAIKEVKFAFGCKGPVIK